MCSRYTITSPIDALRELFGLSQPLPNLEPNYNIAPTDPVPFVRPEAQEASGVFLDFARWGLVPAWSKQLPKTPLINARSESVHEKASFKAAFRRRRCLVPMDGFYEWQPQDNGPKQPFYVQKAGGGPFAIAGIWDAWVSPEGDDLISVAILTTEANSAMRPIHSRVPVVLQPQDFPVWMDCRDETQIDAASSLLHPPSDEFWKFYPVERAIGNVRAEGAFLIEPLAPPPDAPGDAQGSLGF